MSIYQLRTNAASLEQPQETEADPQQEPDRVNVDNESEQGGDEDTQELRAQALRALLLARKRKRPSEDKERESAEESFILV